MSSPFLIASIGFLSKLAIHARYQTTIHNKQKFLDLMEKYLKEPFPLLTVSNHPSVIDDPLLWGALLTPRRLIQLAAQSNDSNLKGGMRWVMGAEELLFRDSCLLTKFFRGGRVIPIARGQGIEQPGFTECVEKLALNGWVHIFPDGGVKARERWKWGVGVMLQAVPQATILPIKLVGFENWKLRGGFRPAASIVVGHPFQIDHSIYKTPSSITSMLQSTVLSL